MKILVDGMNLSLAEGTGIATYTLNLTSALKALGHEVHIVYGENRIFARDDVARAALFFDPRAVGRTGGRVAKLARTVRRILGQKPYEIDFSQIERDPATDRFAFADKLWNVRDLFGFANRWFYATGKMLELPNVMGADIAHWTYPMPIRLKGAKNFYTVHDLVPLKLPYTTLDNKLFTAKVLRKIADTADRIVTVSETSRADIVNTFKLNPEKVVNTYQSVIVPERYKFTTDARISRFLDVMYGLDRGQYFLFYGAVEPKKNVRRLVEAYIAAEVDIPLVIAGKSGWLDEEPSFDGVKQLSRARARAAPNLHVIWRASAPEIGNLEADETDGEGVTTRTRAQSRFVYDADGRYVLRARHVPYRHLVRLIQGARAVVFPSVYEGFGLPVVEAMMCGTPVVTSETGALAEIAGDAAVLVNPYDTDSIAAGLESVVANTRLADRLTALGNERARMFSQDAYCRRLAELYA